jgi:hypothetical protein
MDLAGMELGGRYVRSVSAFFGTIKQEKQFAERKA